MAKLTKKQKTWTVDTEKLHGVDEAIGIVKANATSKFDETIEVALNLGVDPRHADQMVRGVVTLPKGTGKTVRVGVFAKGAKAEEALAAGADVVGAEDLMEIIQGGKIDFDRCIATPDMTCGTRAGLRSRPVSGGSLTRLTPPRFPLCARLRRWGLPRLRSVRDSE